MTTTAQDKYEEFRAGQKREPTEPEPPPWKDLDQTTKAFWEKEWGKFTGDLDPHGDPKITELRKPRA